MLRQVELHDLVDGVGALRSQLDVRHVYPHEPVERNLVAKPGDRHLSALRVGSPAERYDVRVPEAGPGHAVAPDDWQVVRLPGGMDGPRPILLGSWGFGEATANSAPHGRRRRPRQLNSVPPLRVR